MDNSEAQKKERGKEVKKRIIALSLVLAMSASLTFPVAAARKDEVQAEKAATESKLSAAESKADELESEKNALLGEIDSLDQSLVQTMAQIEILNGEISDKESAIEDTKQKLEDAQAEKDKQYASMKKRIQYLYENGGSNAWAQMILESGSITDMFDKAEYTEKMYQYDRDELQKMKDVVTEVTQLGEQLTQEKAELEDISTVCKECGLYLFLDGARMGYGLMAPGTDVTLPDIAKCCDVFYIGGTKVGALFGEAVVITNPCLKQDFRYCIKQKGGMLAKGRLLGVQFLELFKDGLYFEISKHAIDMAMLLKDGLKEKGYEFFMDSNTNQQFIIVEDAKLQEIRQKYGVTYQERYDETHSVIRLCTSWATKEENVKAFLQDM